MNREPAFSVHPLGRAIFNGLLFAAAFATVMAIPAEASPLRSARVLSVAEVKRMVIREARDMNVPVALALAVAHAESSFNPRAESHVGARGVMQIMPATAMGEYGIRADQLWNPRINIRLGLHFLKRLISMYGGRTDLALSYYNGGSRVGRPGKARVLPATRSYVHKVHRLAAQYRKKFGKGKV